MKLEKSVLIVNGIIFGIGMLLLLQGGMNGTGFGILGIFMAFVNIVMIVIFSITGNRNAMLNSLVFAGVLFTIGFSVCSGSTMNFH